MLCLPQVTSRSEWNVSATVMSTAVRSETRVRGGWSPAQALVAATWSGGSVNPAADCVRSSASNADGQGHMVFAAP